MNSVIKVHCCMGLLVQYTFLVCVCVCAYLHNLHAFQRLFILIQWPQF